MILFAAGVATAGLARDAVAQYEKPPVLTLDDAAPPALRQGAGFRVDPKVPTDGLTTVFTLRSEAAPVEARGVETLRLRESEVPAILELRKASKGEAFAKALGNTAMRPVKAAANIVTHPVESVQGLPEGLGRFFDRVGSGAERLYDAATDSSKPGSERAAEVAEKSGQLTADALGFEQELRRLAKQLGVDPYTSNPELAELLHDFATAAFAGRVGLNTLISVVVPASMAITATNVSNDLIWDTPRGDLVVRNEDKLRAMDIPDAAIRKLQQAPGFTLSSQTAFVEQLARLDGVEGRADVVAFAGTARDADQAFFLTRGLRMLGEHHAKRGRLASVAAKGTVFAREKGGAIVVPGAVDYVSWTKRLEGFATREDLAAPERGVWITGRTSPRAKQQLEARGWSVHENVAP